MQIYLKALGCRLNEAELENWASEFQSNGHTINPSPEQADVIVINTCAVTNEAVKKSRQLIRRTHRKNPNAKLVVSGCYASLTPNLSKELQIIDLLIPNQSKDNLVDIVNNELSVETMPSLATVPGETPLYKRGRHRAFIKIQDGCRYRCTFCIVTVARGDERSNKSDKIISQINRLHKEGIQEVVLTGVHVGGYGNDINTNLQSLVREILKCTDIPRLRLASVEPWDFGEGFFSLFDNPRLMPHMHLPLQSGSDPILKRMARRCKTAEFKQLLEYARSRIPDFNVTTDIIVGFPGETDELWKQGLEFIENIGFSHMHIFQYSPREGTKAAIMDDAVPNDVKKSRSKHLHRLAEIQKQHCLQRMVGRQFSVLFENSIRETGAEDTRYFGYSPNFLRVEVKTTAENQLSNSIRQVTATGLSESKDTLLASLD